MLDRLSILQGDPLWLKIVWVPFRLDPMSPNPNYPNLGCFRFRHDHDVCFSDCWLTLDLLPKQEFFGPNIIAGLQKKMIKKSKNQCKVYMYYFYFNVSVKILNWQNWDIFIIYTSLANHTFFSANIFSSIAKHVILVHEDNRAFWKVIPFFVLFWALEFLALFKESYFEEK